MRFAGDMAILTETAEELRNPKSRNHKDKHENIHRKEL